MADISKIKLPNGNEYDIKDSTARSNSGVTGVKGNAESSYRTGNVNLTPANVGAAASSHTHIPTDIITPATYGINGMDVISGTKIGSYLSNKTFNMPANAIEIEYSKDSGNTWTDYGVTDAQKKNLFSETRATNFYIGKSTTKTEKSLNDRLRVTISATDRYVGINMIYLWYSTQGNTSYIDLEYSKAGDPTTFLPVFSNQQITGWSGHNVRYFSIPLFGGLTNVGNTAKIRVTFKMTALGADYPAGCINDIRFYGPTVHSAPNNMVLLNHLYTWDSSLNATFPQKVTANGGFSGALTGTATTATRLELQANVTGSTVDDFRGSYLRYAKITNLDGTGLAGDGVIIWIPWSDSYGRQLIIEEASGHTIYSRYYNSGTWSSWRDITYRWDCDPLLYGGIDTGLGSGTPASNAKTYYSDTSKVPANSIKSFYNTSGVEYSILFSNRGSYGSILKWGYNDKYMRILRMYNGTWKSEDWEKMDAGNADTVNGKTVGVSVPANAKFTDTTYTGTSPITVSNANAIGINTASTSAYGATKLNTATNSTSTTEAATPSAVKIAKDRADEAYTKAATVESGLNGTLIYDHSYTISNGVATFTPHVYLKGEEVTSNYAKSCFVWKYKLANDVTGTPSYIPLTTNDDRTCTVTISVLGYGGYVLGEFTPA